LLLVLALVSVAGMADDKSPLLVGDNLPGPFHPFNVNGPRKDSFSCPVSASGLEPGILVFVRDLEAGEAFKGLLQKLDNAVAKNPKFHLTVTVVFLSEDLKDVVGGDDKQDDKREELVGKIDDIVKALMLKHVVCTLTTRADVKAYRLAEDAVYTLVAYHKYQIRAVESLDKDKLTAEKVQALVAMLGEKLGLKQK